MNGSLGWCFFGRDKICQTPVDIVATCQSVIVFSWFAAAYCTQSLARRTLSYVSWNRNHHLSQRQYNRSDFVWMSIWVWWVGSMLVRSVRLSACPSIHWYVCMFSVYIPSINADRLTKKQEAAGQTYGRPQQFVGVGIGKLTAGWVLVMVCYRCTMSLLLLVGCQWVLLTVCRVVVRGAVCI